MRWRTRKQGTSAQKGKRFPIRGRGDSSTGVRAESDSDIQKGLEYTEKERKLYDATVYEGKDAGRGRVWIHEGYYGEDRRGEAIKVARQHHGVYKLIQSGLYKGSYEVFAPVSKVKLKVLGFKAEAEEVKA